MPDTTIVSVCDKWGAILPEMSGLNCIHFGDVSSGNADDGITIERNCGADAIIVS